MSRGRVEVRDAAIRDLAECADFLAREDGFELALRFLDCAERTFGQLAELPESGVRRAFRDQRLDGVRSRPVAEFRAHLIFYRPTPDGIDVLRVLHGARDLDDAMSSVD